mmetsp:Transcript_119197/g.315092  ORF Transcript_119197/g.315092 Transcript_119197/m.315092 type:complete len:163 (+) Transcript_119197:130-618(+)
MDLLDKASVAELLHVVAVIVKDNEDALWVVLISETMVLTLPSVTVLAVVLDDSVELLVMEPVLPMDVVGVSEFLYEASVAELVHVVEETSSLRAVLVGDTVVLTPSSATVLVGTLVASAVLLVTEPVIRATAAAVPDLLDAAPGAAVLVHDVAVPTTDEEVT